MNRKEKIRLLKGLQQRSISASDLREKKVKIKVNGPGKANQFFIDGKEVSYDRYLDESSKSTSKTIKVTVTGKSKSEK